MYNSKYAEFSNDDVAGVGYKLFHFLIGSHRNERPGRPVEVDMEARQFRMLSFSWVKIAHAAYQ